MRMKARSRIIWACSDGGQQNSWLVVNVLLIMVNIWLLYWLMMVIILVNILLIKVNG